MANYNRPAIPQSTIIDLKGRPVGSEDMEQAALLLQWAEQAGYRGTNLDVASVLSQGLRDAVAMSERGEHAAAGKQAGNCLWVLQKNRDVCAMLNIPNLGSIEVPCRDGQLRRLGNMVAWYSGLHNRIHEQIEEAKAFEAKVEDAELESLQLAASLIKGTESIRKVA